MGGECIYNKSGMLVDELLSYSKPMYYFTYYGDVYYGTVTQHNSCFYIIPPGNQQEYNRLNDCSRDSYRKLGWEIKDSKIITKISEKIQYDESTISEISFPKKCKKLLIFGAGASAYCTFNEEKLKNDVNRLPLGNELLNERYSYVYYDGVKELLPLYEAYNHNIENLLEVIWEKIKTSRDDVYLRRLINTQFYVQDVIKNCTEYVWSNYNRYNAYSLFVSKLRDFLMRNTNEAVAMVSFNYDTLLENSIEKEFSIFFKDMNDYLNRDNSFYLFKPHGSVNWGWKVKDTSRYETQKDFFDKVFGDSVDLSTMYYEILGDTQTNVKKYSWGLEYKLTKGKGRFSINKDQIKIVHDGIFYPALLTPHRDKDEFIMPYNHTTAMFNAMKQAEELYIIGWKGNEHLFNEELKKQRVGTPFDKIVVVDPDIQNVLCNINSFCSYKRIEPYNCFGDFVKKISF